MNLANKLTVIRVIFVPIFLLCMSTNIIPYGTFIATIIFILASITDKLDGYIARSRNQVTNFGKFMDPLADKLLVTAALITLVGVNIIPAWITVVIISREFAVSGLRSIAAAEGHVIAASNWGKIKTVFQMVAIVLLLIVANIATTPFIADIINSSSILINFFTYVPNIILYIALIITIISGIDYFVKNKSVINTNK
ncbi:CDP-diacylglycerol--glycerol-3-phosphate 3-phosphatidyltransferase [uncultured Clostridium sp.]|jgi:CDP-diacylglycerol--glycerol-3-phosphate 3-phosphatidyltransferase|uniref:CDP-diacylglycerol--glycerol-3-phosphate 3-phosphatidyltransferase n=1 Tax=uncultured Clostridium sp. TaxID=59620 RepID=UPI0026140ABD|nr:CDP-diacylglycerol--glycerol-3-phosphate 3-phosphatidyltransferase [uncultured Clostridium sp.]